MLCGNTNLIAQKENFFNYVIRNLIIFFYSDTSFLGPKGRSFRVYAGFRHLLISYEKMGPNFSSPQKEIVN